MGMPPRPSQNMRITSPIGAAITQARAERPSSPGSAMTRLGKGAQQPGQDEPRHAQRDHVGQCAEQWIRRAHGAVVGLAEQDEGEQGD